jgi:hypothetical protein
MAAVDGDHRVLAFQSAVVIFDGKGVSRAESIFVSTTFSFSQVLNFGNPELPQPLERRKPLID